MDCPVCNSTNTIQDLDSPDTMRECQKCGSEWVVDGMEITLDARDYFTDEENFNLKRNLKNQ